MPWEKSFDEETAVESAMQVFWEKGFEPASIADLLAGTGLNRGSLYNAFGGKQQLLFRPQRNCCQIVGEWSDGLVLLRAVPSHRPCRSCLSFAAPPAGGSLRQWHGRAHRGCRYSVPQIQESSARLLPGALRLMPSRMPSCPPGGPAPRIRWHRAWHGSLL